MIVKLMKQNKNTPFVRVASAALAAFVLFFALCVPSFADSSPSFSEQPLPETLDSPNSATYSASLPAFVLNDVEYRVSIVQSSENEDTYAFYESTNRRLYFVSSAPVTGHIIWPKYVGATQNNADTVGVLSNNFNSTYSLYANYYYGALANLSPSSVLVPSYSSLDYGLAAVRNYIDNGDGGIPAHIAVTLKPGYVGYFDISNLSNVSVSLGTSLFSGAKYPGFSTDQSIGTVSSLPSGSFSLPIAGTSSISWAGSGQKDLIGRFSSFSFSHVYSSAGGSTYLVVVNPLSGSVPVLSALGASGSNRNGNITVLIDQCRGSKIYSLTESLAIGSGTLDTESNGTSVNDGVYDPDTGAWNFTDPTTGLPEDPSSLPVGGGNDPIIGGTGGNTINEWLEDIANSIKSFFSGAIGAVTTLVSSGSDFIHSLSGLYAWLPGPVYSVLVSALILVITIGVIKVFI